MFPDFDAVIIQAVLAENEYDIKNTIESLLPLSLINDGISLY